MADEPAPAPIEQIPGNDPTARTETGEIKDQQAVPPKTEETKPAEGEKKPDATKPADKGAVPEKYEFKAPEGATLNEALIAEATPLFKEMGLSQENAQKLFDFHNKAIADIAAAPGKAYEDMRTNWRNEVASNKAIGDGKGLSAKVQKDVSQAIDALPNAKEFREAMNITGVGDNPAFVIAVNHWAKALAEGTPVKGGNPSPLGQTKTGTDNRPTPAQAMYPGLPSSAQS